MSTPEMTFNGPDGTVYTYEQWRNAHISSVYESMLPGGKTVYGGACSCGWRTPPYTKDKTNPQQHIDTHLLTTWLGAEMQYEDGN